MVGLLGLLVLRLVAGGGYRAYVRPRMGVLLLLASTCLVVVVLVEVFTSARSAVPPPSGSVERIGRRSAPRRPGVAMSHRHEPGRGWSVEVLVLVPIVLIAVMPPVPLGVAAAGLKPTARHGPGTSYFPRLPPPVEGAIPLTVSEFVGRALYDSDASLQGVPVRLVGMAGPDPAAPAGGFLLIRFAMFCCAADAVPMRVHIRDRLASHPAEDTWVEVVGTWRPAPPLPPTRFDLSMMPTVDAVSVRTVSQPADPYDPPF
jgi:uncharacterized repeat protein (TIGR03943 family)